MRLERCHNIEDFRRMARQRLPAPLFHFIDGGSDDEFTLRNNTAAFDDYRLLPNALADLSGMDLSTTVLGQKIDWPVILAPTGMSRMFHHDGEHDVEQDERHDDDIDEVVEYFVDKLHIHQYGATTALHDESQNGNTCKVFELKLASQFQTEYRKCQYTF